MGRPELQIQRADRVAGTLVLPGDKSLSHRALLLAAVAAGPSHFTNLAPGNDVRSTRRALAALGIRIRALSGGAGWMVEGVGAAAALTEPDQVIDCGNSGTTARLLCGLLGGAPLTAVLTGDASLRRRPMDRVIGPLSRMGVVFTARAGGSRLPLALVGTAAPTAGLFSLSVPSAQVQSAILLTGLAAAGTTTIVEPGPMRDHTWRLLAAMGAAVTRQPHGGTLVGPVALRPLTGRIPGDPSTAAFFAVLAAIHPGSEIVLAQVSLNPTRLAFLDTLRAMGATIETTIDAGAGFPHDVPAAGQEPVGTIVVRGPARLRAVDIGGAGVAALIDELPALAVAMAVAEGRSTLTDAAELQVKESDRLAGIADLLTAFGIPVAVAGSGLVVDGRREGPRVASAVVDPRADHRLAMAAAILATRGVGISRIETPSCLAVSCPGFARFLCEVAPGTVVAGAGLVESEP